MSIAALIRSMSEAGAPPEAIALAVEAIEARDSILAAQRFKDAERSRRYRASGGGQVPEELRREVFARDGWACVECAAVDHLQCDHIHPVSKGGETSLENLQTLCRPCNARKKDRIRKRDFRGMSSDDCRKSVDIPMDNPSPNKSPPDPQKLTPTPPTHTGDAPARKAEPFPRPDWADPQVWSDLLANRRKKGLANTVSAHRKLLADVERLTDENWPPGRVLEAAVSRGWGAIYAGCKDEDDGRTNGMGRNRTSGDGYGRTIGAAHDFVSAGGTH